MNTLSTFFLFLSILLFAIGALMLVRFFVKQKEVALHLTVVFDVDDSDIFYEIMRVLQGYELIDSEYVERDDCGIIRIVVPKRFYTPMYNALKKFLNVEVI